MRAFVVDARDGSAAVRAAIDQAAGDDRFVLVADASSERRAAALGLRTGSVFGPATLRRLPLLPPSDSARSLRACLESFDELIFSSPGLLDQAANACAGRRSLPSRCTISETAANRVGVPQASRRAVRAAVDCGEDALIALATDPGDSCIASDFLRVCQILAIVGHRVTALVPREASDLSRAKEIVRSTGIGVRLVTTELPMWCMLAGLDAAVIDVAESPLVPVASNASRSWMLRCCARLGVRAVVGRSLVDDLSQFANTSVTLAESRLPVHVARALDAALRSAPVRRPDDRPPSASGSDSVPASEAVTA